ncbi:MULTISPECIES: hypothetical protein [Aneurinibacillus]|uniref:Uncharacterized protein n=1 Tax=Aneurinibacillus thermoaerophilus TaxID=143495 RepID=A0A1G8E0I8_ANETH|nr:MULTISPECIES: hypothetical protein [Aneurinibacillus]AMA74153.1 hypothetical protein ACH33_15890 [Aneurinibacillus sp. XH2]MED0677263.1 hypothetical protein [Aneurinibacillus thermoaerophilus]MED0677884.1 hypothetical protein [Aneurinibacillus thermoaerophilus]MED0738560.1 hypothetical protein [Aneurinibacillus thermoaerophilus]MED0758393.1 hypothetical protein [Aneurinibacillus thermoaerophilus]
MNKWIKTVGLSAMLVAGSLIAGNAIPASAAGLGDILGSVNSLVGSTNVSSGSLVNASGPNFNIQAGSTYTVNQDGVTGLLGGVLGGTYNTSANLSGPNGLSASASTNGGYGLASSVQSLVNGLGGLLGGLLK